MASVQSRIDTNRVWQALLPVDDYSYPLLATQPRRASPNTGTTSILTTATTTSSTTPTTTFSKVNNSIMDNNNSSSNNYTTRRPVISTTDLLYEHEMDRRPPAAAAGRSSPASRYQISLAAAIVCGIASNVLFGHNTILSLLIAISAFLTAYLDDDNDNNSSSLTAALVRILGRTTIRSVRASEPTIKAVARVVLTGQEEVPELQRTIRQLQHDQDLLRRENDALRQWQTTYTYIHNTLWPRYTLVQLKELCQRHELPVSGTKLELIQRLLDAGWLVLEE